MPLVSAASHRVLHNVREPIYHVYNIRAGRIPKVKDEPGVSRVAAASRSLYVKVTSAAGCSHPLADVARTAPLPQTGRGAW